MRQAGAGAAAVDVLDDEPVLVELVDELSLLVLVEAAGEVEVVEPRLSLR
jgi:hypothetical protein